jgi:hypothetical protein
MSDCKKDVIAEDAFRAYPSIVALGSNARKSRSFTGLNRKWSCQEKVDGSQISLSTTDGDTLRFFCGKRERLPASEPATSLFTKLMAVMQTHVKLLRVGHTYHGETIQVKSQCRLWSDACVQGFEAFHMHLRPIATRIHGPV